jgi:hypothetical protein
VYAHYQLGIPVRCITGNDDDISARAPSQANCDISLPPILSEVGACTLQTIYEGISEPVIDSVDVDDPGHSTN